MGDISNQDDWFSSKKDDSFWDTPAPDQQNEDTFHKADQVKPTDSFQNPYQKQETEFKQSDGVIHYGEQTGSQKSSGLKHPHIVVCLVFIAITFLLSAAIFIYGWNYKKEHSKGTVPSETTVEQAGNQIHFKNNLILLEDQAYVIKGAEQVYGFPEGEKLIALYINIKSDTFETDADPFANFYLDCGLEYRQAVNASVLYPYVGPDGFTENYVLGIFGIGNGHNSAGYIFFLVPRDAKDVTLYLEDHVDRFSPAQKIYKKNYSIIVPSAEEKEQLLKREVNGR